MESGGLGASAGFGVVAAVDAGGFAGEFSGFTGGVFGALAAGGANRPLSSRGRSSRASRAIAASTGSSGAVSSGFAGEGLLAAGGAVVTGDVGGVETTGAG